MFDSQQVTLPQHPLNNSPFTSESVRNHIFLNIFMRVSFLSSFLPFQLKGQRSRRPSCYHVTPSTLEMSSANNITVIRYGSIITTFYHINYSYNNNDARFESRWPAVVISMLLSLACEAINSTDQELASPRWHARDVSLHPPTVLTVSEAYHTHPALAHGPDSCVSANTPKTNSVHCRNCDRKHIFVFHV